MQLKSEAPKSRLAALTAGGAGLGAGIFGLGKSAAAGNAAKGAAAKSAATATSADAAEVWRCSSRAPPPGRRARPS